MTLGGSVSTRNAVTFDNGHQQSRSCSCVKYEIDVAHNGVDRSKRNDRGVAPNGDTYAAKQKMQLGRNLGQHEQHTVQTSGDA